MDIKKELNQEIFSEQIKELVNDVEGFMLKKDAINYDMRGFLLSLSTNN